MQLLLPPSETKHPGGDGAPLDLGALRLPGLRPQREALLDALVALSGDEAAAMRVLKLSERQRPEIRANAAIREAATMPAMDRYTGVLFDALEAGTLPTQARGWLADHALIQTAPLGPIGAADPIPSYRLAAGTALPGVPPLRRHWADATSAAFADDPAVRSELVLDLRSQAYVALAPLPSGITSAYVHVVTRGADGHQRALNHFNKKAKGEFVRALALDPPPRDATLAAVVDWGRAHGQELVIDGEARVNLVV